MLKFNLDKASYDSADDTTKALYSANGDGFVLQVEGATSNDKLKEFRDNNITLTNELEKFKGVDMDKYNATLETERKLKEKELIDKGDFETLLSERMKTITSDYDGKLTNIQSQLEMSENNNKSMINRYEIDGVATAAFDKYHIKPDARPALKAQVSAMFSVDGGNVVGKDGDKILAGKDGNLTISEFIAGQPEFMKIASNGGNGNGNQGDNNSSDPMAARKAAYEKKFA